MNFKSEKLKPLVPYFLLATAIIVMYKVITEFSFFVGLMKWIWAIITPFLIGFMLAYILNIPCSGLQNLFGKIKFKFFKKAKKVLSLILILLILALVILFVINLVTPSVYRSISLFTSNLPSYYEGFLGFIDYVNGLDLFGLDISADKIMAMLQDVFQDFNIESLATPVKALFGVSSAIFTGFLAFISAIYMLLEKEKLLAFFRRLLRVVTSQPAYGAITKYAASLNQNFKRYIFTQTIDGLILGTIVTIELYIIGSPYALVLGIILGILNYIPYFGSIFGSIIAIIVVAFTQGLSTAAIAAIVLLVTQQIDGNIIQPRLMGGSFSLSPLLIIVSITIGGAIAGILGMIAAIPIVAVLKDILESVIAYYEEKKLISADEAGDES